MSLGAFYRLVFKRAWQGSFDRARKLGFLVTIAVGIVLFLAQFFIPPTDSSDLAQLEKAARLAWTVPLAVLILGFLWLVIRAPHQLFVEQENKLDDALKAVKKEGIAPAQRKIIRERLSEYIFAAQDILKHVQPYQSDIETRSRLLPKARAWSDSVVEYLQNELGKEYHARFTQTALNSPATMAEDLTARCDVLHAIIRELS